MTKKQSIAFISFHKCATSFFSSYILKQAEGLEHIDYAAQLYNNGTDTVPAIEEKSKIYGVIRILDKEHPSYHFINDFLSDPVLDRLDLIFWTRDPRDILVSMYYSFGFSHGFSNISSIKKYQMKRREKIQQMSLDEYVLSEAPVLLEKFEMMQKMMQEKNNYILLSYEEMINDFDIFFHKLSSVIPIDSRVKEKIYEDTRPRSTEDAGSHKRQGSIGAHKEKLGTITIDKLNQVLWPVLTHFNYEKGEQ